MSYGDATQIEYGGSYPSTFTRTGVRHHATGHEYVVEDSARRGVRISAIGPQRWREMLYDAEEGTDKVRKGRQPLAPRSGRKALARAFAEHAAREEHDAHWKSGGDRRRSALAALRRVVDSDSAAGRLGASSSGAEPKKPKKPRGRVQTGKRGGRFIVTASGKKHYLGRNE